VVGTLASYVVFGGMGKQVQMSGRRADVLPSSQINTGIKT